MAIDPPLKLMLPEPAVAVAVPVQVPPKPFGVATPLNRWDAFVDALEARETGSTVRRAVRASSTRSTPRP